MEYLIQSTHTHTHHNIPKNVSSIIFVTWKMLYPFFFSVQFRHSLTSFSPPLARFFRFYFDLFLFCLCPDHFLLIFDWTKKVRIFVGQLNVGTFAYHGAWSPSTSGYAEIGSTQHARQNTNKINSGFTVNFENDFGCRFCFFFVFFCIINNIAKLIWFNS